MIYMRFLPRFKIFCVLAVFSIIALSIVIDCHKAFAQECILKIPQSRSYYDSFKISVINTALKETEEEYGPYEIQLVKIEINATERRVIEIDRGVHSNIDWMPTTKEIEEKLLPIRFPLYRGLLGFRALVVRQEDKSRISQFTTLEQLKSLLIGHGKGWLDSGILTDNGFRVVLGDSKQALYKMLAKHRFDCLPRGIVELNEEFGRFNTDGIDYLDSTLIYYPYPVYFFVSKSNAEIASRIEVGLTKALENGSYDKLLIEALGKTIEKFSEPNINVIQLNNPLLSQDSLERVNRYLPIEYKRHLGMK